MNGRENLDLIRENFPQQSSENLIFEEKPFVGEAIRRFLFLARKMRKISVVAALDS